MSRARIGQRWHGDSSAQQQPTESRSGGRQQQLEAVFDYLTSNSGTQVSRRAGALIFALTT